MESHLKINDTSLSIFFLRFAFRNFVYFTDKSIKAALMPQQSLKLAKNPTEMIKMQFSCLLLRPASSVCTAVLRYWNPSANTFAPKITILSLYKFSMITCYDEKFLLFLFKIRDLINTIIGDDRLSRLLVIPP